MIFLSEQRHNIIKSLAMLLGGTEKESQFLQVILVYLSPGSEKIL